MDINGGMRGMRGMKGEMIWLLTEIREREREREIGSVRDGER